MAKVDSDRPSLAARLVVLVALPLALYALYATGEKALESYRLNQRASQISEEVEQLRAENLRLQRQIEESRSDSTIEKMAREQLGLVKPGDQAVVVVAPTMTPALEPSVPPRAESPPPPTWEQWWHHFFGLTED